MTNIILGISSQLPTDPSNNLPKPGRETMKNSIYFFRDLKRRDMSEEMLTNKPPVNHAQCSIHLKCYEYFCSDCECLSCEDCRTSGPHHEETHKLVHLEQIIGLIYANQAYFLGNDFLRTKRIINQLHSESVRFMHQVKREADQTKIQTVR